MVYPVTAYGHPVLRRKAGEIGNDFPGLSDLISNMFETMYISSGIGLAAPQINQSIRLFVVDATPYADEIPGRADLKKVVINPVMIEEYGDEWSFNEGCLSIPGIREDVMRKPEIRITWYDEHFQLHDERIDGILARIIQHEYDHLEGILFVDRIPAIRRLLLKKKLANITTGNIDVDYKMIFPKQKKSKT
ncbi:MAG: peptide deformylase [Bacteroidales bacterium]|nr:peptide deformylase [Bacteroidales bacterium]